MVLLCDGDARRRLRRAATAAGHRRTRRPFFAGAGLRAMRWMSEIDDGVELRGGREPGEREDPLGPCGPVK